jgi:hypothetical protein
MVAMEYHARLTNFYAQFRAIGMNYNQAEKALKTAFTEKKRWLFCINWKMRHGI